MARRVRGQTNHVLALDEAARWREATSTRDADPVGCVSFNYDTLLERAVYRVHGERLSTLEEFVGGDAVRVYKPHGSVEWRQRARWDMNEMAPADEAIHWAIDAANVLRWEEEYSIEDPDDPDHYQEAEDPRTLWLPALAIPARRKAAFTMPAAHMQALRTDLAKVTIVVAVGWRAREQHFLALPKCMPHGAAELVVVAESEMSAQATTDALWSTGRFRRYALASNGFSNFAKPTAHGSTATGGLTFRDVLTGEDDMWTMRDPGQPEPMTILEPEDAAVDPNEYRDFGAS